jgi:hypothetical protein
LTSEPPLHLRTVSVTVPVSERDTSKDEVREPQLPSDNSIPTKIEKQTSVERKTVRFESPLESKTEKIEDSTEILANKDNKDEKLVARKKKKKKKIEYKLSPFGLLWTALTDWKTKASVRFLKELSVNKENETSTKDEESPPKENPEEDEQNIESLWEAPEEPKENSQYFTKNPTSPRSKRVLVLSSMIAKQFEIIIGFSSTIS